MTEAPAESAQAGADRLVGMSDSARFCAIGSAARRKTHWL
jgi:hypothetical protein